MSTEFETSGHAALARIQSDAVATTLPATTSPHGAPAGMAAALTGDRPVGAALPSLLAPLLAALLDLAACRVELRRVLNRMER